MTHEEFMAYARKVNEDFAKQNAKTRAILDETIPFWNNLIQAVQYDSRDPRSRVLMRSLMRPKL